MQAAIASALDRAAGTPAAAFAVQCTGLAKRFGSLVALGGVDLQVRKGEFVCLLGPSGCGKTTLLRVLAGLEQQDAGAVWMNGREVSALAPGQRDFGIVFQSYALFPNLTAAQNIAYGLRTGADARRRRVHELLDLMGLWGNENKYPAQLSGGQQQRIALARALASAPNLLLLDEPLSALDAQVRERLRGDLRDLQGRLGVTTIMVTHDQEEALALADTVVVMNRGQVEQVGTPEQVYRHPVSPFVANFVGRANWVAVTCTGPGAFTVAGVALQCPQDQLGEVAVGGGRYLFCRPEDVRLCGPDDAAAGGLIAEVLQVDFMGGVRRVLLALVSDRTVRLHADVGPHDAIGRGLCAGQRVHIALAPEQFRFFDAAPQ